MIVNIRTTILLLGVLFTMISCVNETDTAIPEGILLPDTMASIMTDIHIAEATIMLNRIDDNQKERNAIFIRDVLKKHKCELKDAKCPKCVAVPTTWMFVGWISR